MNVWKTTTFSPRAPRPSFRPLHCALCILHCALGLALAAEPAPEVILQEAIDYFESAGGTRKIVKEDPNELSFDIKDDFTLGGVEAAPKVDVDRLIQAGRRYATKLTEELGDHREAVRMLRACRAVEAKRGASAAVLHGYDFSIAAHLAKCGGKEKEEAIAMLEGLMAAGVDKMRCISAIFMARIEGRDPYPGFDWLEEALRADTFKLNRGQQHDLWNLFGGMAFWRMKRPLMERAAAGAESIGVRLEGHAAMAYDAMEKLDEMATFPKAESEIRFPKGIADFGVEIPPDAKVVHAKDCDIWDDKDATGCLQEALASDASTIIIDNMGVPWRIKGVKLTEKMSNKTIIFKKGVRVHAVDDGLSWRNTLFGVGRVENVAFIGEEDVQIGHFATYEERVEKSRGEGGSGFSLGGKNILLKNLKVSNCVCDALSIAEGYNIYVEDCDFDCNYRQGASFGASRDVYFRNVKFRNTRGGAPGCGVDFEPSYEVYPNNNYYFFDCEFADNVGDAGMMLATSTYLPVTIYAKRCVFHSPGTDIAVRARAGIYVINNSPAPSKVIFDECRIDGHSDSAPIRFISTSLFNVTFTNCVIRDAGPVNPKRPQNQPPVLFLLDRAHWRGFCPLDGNVRFDDCVITGFTNSPPIRFLQTYGAYGVTNIFGTVNFNGKTVKLDGMAFRPPEMDWEDVPASLDFAAFTPPAAVPGEQETRAFSVRYGGAYYQSPPKITLVHWVAGKEPDCVLLRDKVPEPRNGAYYAGAGDEKMFRINCKPGYTGYFEVPAGKACAIKLMGGGMEIRNGAGEVVCRRGAGDYYGIALLTFRASGGANEVFSFTCLNDFAVFKFFAPLSGLWAEKPEWLPRRLAAPDRR